MTCVPAAAAPAERPAGTAAGPLLLAALAGAPAAVESASEAGASAATSEGAPIDSGRASGESEDLTGGGEQARGGSPPAPPTNVRAVDKPWDAGKKIVVSWELSADDGQGTRAVVGYEIRRASSSDGPFEPTTLKVSAGISEAVDEVPENGTEYYYVAAALAADSEAISFPSGPASASPQWFKGHITVVAIFTLAFIIGSLTILLLSRRGKDFYIRPIGGINAIDEAIGRATEMGRPILFVPGLHEASDVPTLAAFSILSRVARKVADYQCRLIVPCYYSMVMVVAREVVKAAYLQAGRPDVYREQDIFYVTQEQFAYVAAINGIMLRERPATNFYLGAFFAESLVLAETGFRAGSIQIAGTDQPIQIPFFVAACDYTLIGEELYAAAAYLSDDPKQKATLKAQDLGKAAVLAVMAAGIALWVFWAPWAGWFGRLFKTVS